MEVAQYGDTEIPANELKSTIEKLRQCEKDSMKCKMEEDFEVSENFRMKQFSVMHCKQLVCQQGIVALVRLGEGLG